MPDKDIREASLEYHRQHPPGKIALQATKQLTNQRDLALAYTPGVAAACDEIVRDPREASNLTARGNLVARRHQRHRRAGPGRDRSARREAGDGRQGGAVQEVLRPRLLRHRAERARPGQAGRHDRRARADVRRHQPRGHQGARVLLHRAQVPRADEDPGVPRRPARHGDHRRRGDPQRAARRRQGHGQGQARLLRRGRRGARVPRPAGEPRHQAREHLRVGHRGRRVRRPHQADGRAEGASTRRRPTRARSPRSCRARTSSSACPRARC